MRPVDLTERPARLRFARSVSIARSWTYDLSLNLPRLAGACDA
jgi:hypothetical protein